MKTTTRAGRSGFTLIEILVVIAIVAILASILVPVAGKAQRTAKKRRAMVEMNSIKVAALQFHDDHGYMPWPAETVSGRPIWLGEDKWTTDAATQMAVMDYLTGSNALKKAYLQVPEKSRPVDLSMVFNDPWGQPYVIGMDRDLDGVVLPDAVIGGAVAIKERVLVYSLGEPDADEILKTFAQ